MINIVDLFSGAGGLTFGFRYRIKDNTFVKNEDYNFLFANEYDIDAVQTFKKNFPDINMIHKDIRDLKKEDIDELLDKQEVDLIIGGPPCQSYSTIGKRMYDDKARMYEQYLKILKIIRPKMFLFENVKGILSMKEIFYETDQNGTIIYEKTKNKNGKVLKKPVIKGYGEKILDKIQKEFENIDENLGYSIKYKVLNAADFGVPQNRERVFIVGVRNDIQKQWEFPDINKNREVISIKEAIDDLPVLKAGEKIEKYDNDPNNEYQRLMRNGENKLTHHYAANYGEKIKVVIENVPQGEGKNYFNNLINEGKVNKKYYLTSGYANTYARLKEDEPSTTITNNMTTPSGLRCIHYRDNRALSPREGARIQSFPDWFDFSGNMTKVAMQVGNAVPPLLAIAIAQKIKETLGDY